MSWDVGCGCDTWEGRRDGRMVGVGSIAKGLPLETETRITSPIPASWRLDNVALLNALAGTGEDSH